MRRSDHPSWDTPVWPVCHWCVTEGRIKRVERGLRGRVLRALEPKMRESPLPDSNRRPLPYHGSALPTELRGRGAWQGSA